MSKRVWMRKTWYGWHWRVDDRDPNYASGFCFTFYQMVRVVRRFTYNDWSEY